MLCSGLAAGADGGIGSTYNFMPKTILAIYNAFRANDAATALTYQAKANAAIAVVLKHGVLPSSKMILKLRGMDYGECREPFMPVGPEAIEELRALDVE